jgi:hypothetical protein
MTGKPVQTQQIPESPSPGPPAQTAKQETPPQWESVVTSAISLSAQQNNGRPLLGRVCQPELKVCITAITFKNRTGKNAIVKTSEDPSGNIIAREICEFNEFGDVRVCTNWDNAQIHRDMKDANGNWNEIADH